MIKDDKEHISSDEASTIEPIPTDTTLIINAAKCLFCDKILGYQGKFSPDIRYHYTCLESKKCIFCGKSGLNTLCSYKPCTSSFHLFCLQKFGSKNSFDEGRCGLHAEKKKEKPYNWLNSFRKIANSIQNDEFRLNEYKFLKGEIKSAGFSHGEIFWGIINTQYFPKGAKLHQLPILKAKTKQAERKTGKNWLLSAQKSLSKSLLMQSRKNKEILTKCLQKKPEKLKGFRTSEKDLLMFELHSPYRRSFQKEFLQYLDQSIIREAVDADTVFCGVCLEDDYDDDDLILTCMVCGVNSHMQCYGISLDTKDWTCISCKSLSRYKTNCVFCPCQEGILKPTVNVTSETIRTFHNPPIGTQLWCHIFCALHIDTNCIRDKAKIEKIDFSLVDKKKFLATCEICKSSNGACLKCASLKCKKFFHPTCAKKQFLCTRNRTGYEDVSCYCDVHKPSKLRKNIGIREKKISSDILNFIKIYEKIDKKTERKVVKAEFSNKEKLRVFKCVDEYIEGKCGNFELSIKLNRSDKALRGLVEETMNYYTFLDPCMFTIDDIHSKSHDKYECQEFYSKNIMELMKKELKVLKLPVIPYKVAKADEENNLY